GAAGVRSGCGCRRVAVHATTSTSRRPDSRTAATPANLERGAVAGSGGSAGAELPRDVAGEPHRLAGPARARPGQPARRCDDGPAGELLGVVAQIVEEPPHTRRELV